MKGVRDLLTRGGANGFVVKRRLFKSIATNRERTNSFDAENWVFDCTRNGQGTGSLDAQSWLLNRTTADWKRTDNWSRNYSSAESHYVFRQKL